MRGGERMADYTNVETETPVETPSEPVETGDAEPTDDELSV